MRLRFWRPLHRHWRRSGRRYGGRFDGLGLETGEIIRATVPRPSRRLGVVIAALASLVLGLILAVIFVPATDQEAERPRPVVAPRPARVAPVKTVEAPTPAPAKPRAAPANPGVRKGKKGPAVKSADWASPFDRRY